MVFGEFELGSIVLLGLSFKLVSHRFDMLGEHILDGLDASSPGVENVTHAWNGADHDIMRHLHIEVDLHLVDALVLCSGDNLLSVRSARSLLHLLHHLLLVIALILVHIL